MEHNWKLLCLRLADELRPKQREGIVSEIRILAADEEHHRRVRFAKEARTCSTYAADYCANAKATAVEMRGMADDAVDMLKKAQARQRARTRKDGTS